MVTIGFMMSVTLGCVVGSLLGAGLWEQHRGSADATTSTTLMLAHLPAVLVPCGVGFMGAMAGAFFGKYAADKFNGDVRSTAIVVGGVFLAVRGLLCLRSTC